MRNEFQFELEKLNLRHRRKRVWYRIISVLCSIAVFVTTYALILPAITLEASSDSFIIEEKLPQIYELSDGKLKECQELSKKSSINIESFIGRTIYLRSTQETQNIYFSGNTSSFKVNNSDYINFDSDIGLLTIQKDIPKGTTVILGSELSEKSINIKIINECNISFDTNGGNGVFEKITGSSDEIYTLPKEEPILKDKCFIGWKASDGTIYKSAGAYKLTEDAALIAQWKDIDYGAYESTYQKVLEASTLDELWSILGDSEFEDFWISLNENEQSTFEKKYQKLLNDTASQQELNANSETLSVSVSGKLPKDSILKLNNVSEKMSDYIKENLQGLEDELPFEVKLDTLDISVVDKYGHKFTPSEPLKMNIKKLNGSYDSEKYDLFVAHLMDDTLAIDKAIDSDTLQFAELSEESLPLFKDELNAVPSSAEKSDDSIAYTEHKAESNQDGSITIPVESFSIYQVASVNVTTGTYIRANSTIEMNVGESRVFYENTNEAHATWTVTDPTDAVLWNLHDPGKQIENEKWMQKYVWIKITAQHPADKITVTAKYGNSNKSEKFYISIPEPNFYIQNSIPKGGNISVHSDIQNVVSYKWSKESGKIVDEALYPNDTSRINVTIDKEYKLYKIFDATYGSDNSASYYINSSSEWYSLVTEADSPFTLDELAGSPNKYLVSKNGTDAVVTNWLKSNNVQKKIKNFTPVDTKTPTNTDKSVKFSNLDYGYYYITSTLGSAVTVTNAKADVVVIDKNQKSGWGTEGGKFIKTNKGTWGTENTANIGDKLDYKVLVDSAVNYQDDEKITEYIIKDTFGEAISMDLSTVKVNISGNDIKAGYNAITNKPVDSKDTTTTQANCK